MQHKVTCLVKIKRFIKSAVFFFTFPGTSMVVRITQYFSRVSLHEHFIMYLTIASCGGGKKSISFEKAVGKYLALSTGSLNVRTKFNSMHSVDRRNLRAGQVPSNLAHSETEKRSFSMACLVPRLFLVLCLYSMTSSLPPNILYICEK